MQRGRNRICPSCGSFERHRFIALYLDRHAQPLEASRVLHIAPQAGLHARLSGLVRDYHTGDVRRTPLVEQQMDVVALPFENEVFDLVICSHVLQYVSDDRRAIREFARVLKSGGEALIQIPVDRSARTEPVTAERTARWGGVRVYGRDAAERLALARLLEIEVITPSDMLHPDEIARYDVVDHGPRPGTAIYRARRLAAAHVQPR